VFPTYLFDCCLQSTILHKKQEKTKTNQNESESIKLTREKFTQIVIVITIATVVHSWYDIEICEEQVHS
jgi:hypothetical protein